MAGCARLQFASSLRCDGYDFMIMRINQYPFLWHLWYIVELCYTTFTIIVLNKGNVFICTPIGWSCKNNLIFQSEIPSLPACSFFPSSLTSTDAPGHGHIIAIITLQPFVVVARPCGAAILVKLRSTHLAAPTSIWHGTNSRRANQRLCRALTYCWAASCHLDRAEREITS